VDDCPLAQLWPSVARFNWLDMRGGELNVSSARELMDRLDGRTRMEQQAASRDIYVSRGWRPTDDDFAERVCEGIYASKMRLRLVGDSPDQSSFSIDRIREILSCCFGHIAILPKRSTSGTPTELDYKYLTRELALSLELGIPSLVIAEADTPLPAFLEAQSFRLANGQRYRDHWMAEHPDWLEGFAEGLKDPLDPQHMFLATEFNKGSLDWATELRDFIEALTGIPCQIGRDFEGERLRDQIVAGIATSSVFIANLASSEDSDPSILSLNFNTCVEAGIARGVSRARILAGKKALPVLLMAPGRQADSGKTIQLPFMFRDDQITWYENKVELMGHIRRLLLPYRRRVLAG